MNLWQIEANTQQPKLATPSSLRQEQWHMAQQHITEWGVALDCGAHIGECTQQYALRFQQVIAVEPNPSWHTCWHLNCDDLPNVELHTTALGHREGRMRRDTATAQVLEVDDGGEMQMHTLDSWQLTELDFIKIDVDGSEARLLEGACETIRRLQPVIQIEIKTNRRPQVRQQTLTWLSKLGYEPQARVRSDWIYTPQGYPNGLG